MIVVLRYDFQRFYCVHKNMFISLSVKDLIIKRRNEWKIFFDEHAPEYMDGPLASASTQLIFQ